jgi:hypothetical protein
MEQEIIKAKRPSAKGRNANSKVEAEQELLAQQLQSFSESLHVQQMSPLWQKLYVAVRSTISKS